MTISEFEKIEETNMYEQCESYSIESITGNIEFNEKQTISRKRSSESNKSCNSDPTNKRRKTSYFEQSDYLEKSKCTNQSKRSNDPNDPSDKIVFLVTDKNNNKPDDTFDDLTSDDST